MDRRRFIKTAAGLGLTGLSGMAGLLPVNAAPGRISNYGVQLYTIRHLLAENMQRTLAQVAEIGFKEVEGILNLGGNAKDFRAALDQNGLTCVSRHVDPIQLEVETFKTYLEDAHTIGQKYMIMGWIPPEDRVRLDQYKSLIEKLNVASHMCRDAGIQFGYHHHDFEFVELEGQMPYELIFDQTDPDLMKIEMDFYWMAFANKDPFELFDRYPGRFPMCHLKDMDENKWFADVGKGTIDFERNLSRIEQAGFEHFFVEHDEPEDPLETIRYGLETVKKLKIS